MYSSLWDPEPALTLINTRLDDPVKDLLAEIPTIEEHHPRITAVRVFGVRNSHELSEGMIRLGYRFVNSEEDEWILFAKPIESLQDVPEIELDARSWRSADDVYDAFFKAIGAPDWHGRNFDALIDGIDGGAINRLDVPCRIAVRNAHAATLGASDFLKKFADLIRHLNTEGCPIEIKFYDSSDS